MVNVLAENDIQDQWDDFLSELRALEDGPELSDTEIESRIKEREALLNAA